VTLALFSPEEIAQTRPGGLRHEEIGCRVGASGKAISNVLTRLSENHSY
jgi:hypothetical protein